jgi:hypothetical protein
MGLSFYSAGLSLTARRFVLAGIKSDAQAAFAVQSAIFGTGAFGKSALLRRGRRSGGDEIQVGCGDGALLVDFLKTIALFRHGFSLKRIYNKMRFK